MVNIVCILTIKSCFQGAKIRILSYMTHPKLLEFFNKGSILYCLMLIFVISTFDSIKKYMFYLNPEKKIFMVPVGVPRVQKNFFELFQNGPPNYDKDPCPTLFR